MFKMTVQYLLLLFQFTSFIVCQSLFDLENGKQATGGINLPPKFLPGGDMDQFALPEDTPVGKMVYKLLGEDPEGSRIAYSISGDHLSVVRNTGIVSLVRPLDRETQDTLEVIITITDEKGSNTEPNIVSIRREIVVEDRNDNPPKFSEQVFSVTVNETAAVGTRIYEKMLITDADLGSNADIKLTCLTEITPDDCNKFNIRMERLGQGRFTGILIVREPLNYEEKSRYTVAIQAEDLAKNPEPKLSSTATIIIDVQDVQDQPPVFLNGPFTIALNENSPPGTIVETILVRDGDAGQPRKIKLDIINDIEGYFSISTSKMEDDVVKATIVTTGKSIDRENKLILQQGGIYTFGIQATELENNQPTKDITVSNVTIIVKDVNDQPPQFNQNDYTISVPENTGIGTPLPGLDMLVTDSDISLHSQFELELTSVRNADGLFEVYPESGTSSTPVLITVANNEKLDFENPNMREMVVNVVARGGVHLTATATVTILLTDVNDNKPQFQWNSYRYTVPENSSPGTLITRLDAVDLDSGVFGQIRYDLRGFGAEKFFVNDTTGDLYIGNCGVQTCLDYEEQDSFTLTYTATDGGGISVSVPVTISVEDLNDNAPLFEQNEYRRNIRVGALDFEPPLIVKAFDKDGVKNRHPVHGDRIFYKIESGNTADGLFSIDHNSGNIDLTRSLTPSELSGTKFVLTIRATDDGTPPQYSDTKVIINIGVSEGNEAPKFQASTYQVHISELAPSDSFIVQVNATDPDGPNHLLRYHLEGPTIDWFAIDEITGIVRIARGMSIEWDQDKTSHTLNVIATDQGQPSSRSATATLVVEVDDVNDKPPRFAKRLFIHHVAEITAVGTQVLMLIANDPDTNSQLKFELIEPFQIRNKGGYLRNATTSEYFTITETTGILTLTQPLDHENAAVIMFLTMVEDVNADPRYSNQIDRAEVAIYVQAHTDNGPIFSSPWSPAHPVIKAEVAEELEPGIVVLTLKAHDPLTGILISHFELVDEPKAEVVTKPEPDFVIESLFDLVDEEMKLKNETETVEEQDIRSLIELNSLTGEISFKKRIDYEALANKTLQFQVHAIAGTPDSPRFSQAIVQLDIIDTNDNSPQFTQQEYIVRVLESVRYPDPLLTVEATDKDSSKFGEIQYYVSGDGADIFVIEDPSSGVVKVAPNVSLDREKQPSYTFTVIAADQPQGGEEQKRSSALVTVEVSDVNDNAPSFTQSSYTAVVPENAPLDWSVSQVQATDPDEGPGGQMEYVLVGSGKLEGLLTVVPNTGNIVVKGPLTGKGRSDPYTLTVRAQDQGDPQLFTDTQVNLYIGDITANDGVPSFIKPAFDEQAFVLEEAPIGSTVFQAVAVDPDDPATPNGRLIYKFLDDGALGTDHSYFDIHPASGLVTTKARLDRESKPSYTLILVARDQGTPSQQATRMLHVVVKDVDDHPPFFSRTPYDGPLQFSVLEEVETGWEVDTLKAVDLDQGDNAAIDYLITYGDDAGLFQLERNSDYSARLVVKGRINREITDHFLLTVKCFKPSEKPSELRKPYNPQDMSEIQVNVTVKDIDDNDPIFKEGTITKGIRLNAPLHTEVVRLEAVDPDADSGRVSYKLVNVSFIRADHSSASRSNTVVNTSPTVAQTFELDAATGSLTTSQTYGHFVDGYFLLNVCAWTGEEALSRKAFASVKVYVLRETELMKFVFAKSPPEVSSMLSEFQHSVEQVLSMPLTLNLYETQFYASEDGVLNFSSTSSCFQLVDKDYVFDLKDTQLLLNSDRNQGLREVYNKYGVDRVERCVPRGALYEIKNVEIWLLVIGGLIGVGGLIAALTICCLFTRYESKMKKFSPGIKVIERPVMVARLPAQPPGSVVSQQDTHRIYEWQETGAPIDAGSRSSATRSVL